MRLYVLCGPACSGKTSYIKKYLPHARVVSSDKQLTLLHYDDLVQGNKRSIELSLAKIEELLLSSDRDIVYDSTNLTPERRADIFHNIKHIGGLEIIAINISKSFNEIYDNWEKRGKDIALRNIFYLSCIYTPAHVSEGFHKVLTLDLRHNITPELGTFLYSPDKKLQKNIKQENKDILFLDHFFYSAQSSFFEIFFQKLNYIETPNRSEILSLLYSGVYIFCQEYLNTLNLGYVYRQQDFLEGFLRNIVFPKCDVLGIGRDECRKEFYESIQTFKY